MQPSRLARHPLAYIAFRLIVVPMDVWLFLKSNPSGAPAPRKKQQPDIHGLDGRRSAM